MLLLKFELYANIVPFKMHFSKILGNAFSKRNEQKIPANMGNQKFVLFFWTNLEFIQTKTGWIWVF